MQGIEEINMQMTEIVYDITLAAMRECCALICWRCGDKVPMQDDGSMFHVGTEHCHAAPIRMRIAQLQGECQGQVSVSVQSVSGDALIPG